VVQRPGPECGCGGRGCVEAIASVPALMRQAAALGLADNEFGELVAAASSGHEVASTVLREGGEWIGMALATLVHILGPNRILLGGGGLDAAEDLLLAPIREALFAHVQPFLAERLTLGRAALGNDAGLVGAAALAV
jgi:glucokinase